MKFFFMSVTRVFFAVQYKKSHRSQNTGTRMKTWEENNKNGTERERSRSEESDEETERLFVKYYLCSMTRHNLLQNVKINFYVLYRSPERRTRRSKMKFYLNG